MFIKRFWLPEIILVLVLLFVNMVHPAYGYQRTICPENPNTFIFWSGADIPIKFWISNQFNTKEKRAIRRAFNTWGSVENSKLKFIEVSTESQSKIKLIKNTLSVAAETTFGTPPVCSVSDGHITNVVTITFSNKWSFCWFQDRKTKIFCNLNPLNKDLDTYSVALHEIGHAALGLQHPFGDDIFPGPNRVSVVEPVAENEILTNLFQDDIAATQDIYPPNRPPIANAGPDQIVSVGSTVQLDGSGSSDPDVDTLRYAWKFMSKPRGSRARLSNLGIVKPTFIADKAGDYILELRVDDNRGGIATDQVKITANTDITPPALITNFQASDNEDSQSTLTWTNPSDNDLAEVMVRRKTGNYPVNRTDGDLVYQNTNPTPGTAVNHVNTGLTNSTTYYYTVFSRDQTGNWNNTVVPGHNADTGTPTVPPPPPPPLPQWPMFGYNAQHTNQSVFVGPQTNNLNWVIDLSVIDPAQPIYTGSTAIGGDGTIYQVVSAQRTFKVVAYNSDGSVKWEGPEDWFNVNSMIHDLAIGPDGTVYTPFHALDPRDGTIKWSMPVQGFLTVGPDGTVYITDPYNALYAVNPSDGTVKWVFTGDPSNCVWGCIFNSKAAVAPDGTVYISKCDGRTVLYAINPNDGTIKGRAPAQGWSCSGSSLMPISNDKMYRTHNLTNSGTLQVVNLPDLSLSTFISLWGTWASGKGIAIGPDGSLIVLGWDSNGTFVLAINITTNTEKWRFTPHDNEVFWSTTAPAIGADGTIYVGACKKGNFEEGTIYAINSDGALKWSRQSGCVPTQPVIGANGALYIEEFIRVNNYWYKRLLSFKDGGSSGLFITRSKIKPVRVSVFTNRDTGYTFLVDGLNIQNMQLQIYDLAGRVTFNSGWVNNGFTWSLTNNRGRPLANGVYLYIITARRYDGTILRSEVKKLIILR